MQHSSAYKTICVVPQSHNQLLTNKLVLSLGLYTCTMYGQLVLSLNVSLYVHGHAHFLNIFSSIEGYT